MDTIKKILKKVDNKREWIQRGADARENEIIAIIDRRLAILQSKQDYYAGGWGVAECMLDKNLRALKEEILND
jgi:hypothetical protein